MAQRLYKIDNFNKSKASSGSLCAMIRMDQAGDVIGHTIANVDNQGSPGEYYHGTGICKYANGMYTLTINGISYVFDNNGIGKSSNAKEYMLTDCTVEKNLVPIGNASKSRSSSTVTKNEDGTITVEEGYTGETQKDVIVGSLNARDQFAIQALGFLMSKVDDPASLGNNEITNYCDAAYRWAANMMEAAANARAEYLDKTGASVVVDDLGSNSEKLLYDIQKRLSDGIDVLDEKLKDIADAISEKA